MWSAHVKLRLGRLLGEGDQGRVYEGLRIDPTTGLRQTVAVKVLHSRTAVDLWRREFSSLAAVRSPHCVRVLSFERVGGRPALVLELVRGVSLVRWRDSGLGSADDAREILAQVHAGLIDLRDSASYHGDLSPNNVMIDDRGAIRLLDFGLANGSGEQTRCTPEFAAPERRAGLSPAYASDLYSLGCLGAYLCESWPIGSLLDVNPTKRLPPADAPDPERARAIGRKVHALLARGDDGRVGPTEGLPGAVRGRAVGLLAIAAALFALNLPSPQSVARPGFGTLTLVTESWCEARVDGRTIGFAPVSVPVTSHELHLVECAGPGGTARRHVRVKPGERQRLHDRDFSH